MAYLECLECGGRFYSSLPEALQAAEPFAVERVQQLVPMRDELPIPAPTLFGSTPKQSQGFVKVPTVRSLPEAMDWARRAAGERDE